MVGAIAIQFINRIYRSTEIIARRTLAETAVSVLIRRTIIIVSVAVVGGLGMAKTVLCPPTLGFTEL